jgi:predicted ribosome quality control (RQC) complex YloA/Tae2 family protein
VRKKKAPTPRIAYRAFHSKRGTEIRVGRNARDNDTLTFRHAHGNDIWLHTAEAPGSHVVLKVQPRSEPDDEDLLDAAHLAVHFSPLRGAKRCPVHVARRKEVHKPRGAKPGLVTLSGGRILQVRVQPERLERLLRPQKGGS